MIWETALSPHLLLFLESCPCLLARNLLLLNLGFLLLDDDDLLFLQNRDLEKDFPLNVE